MPNVTLSKPQLKYLFEVEYTDNSTFKQTKDDVSKTREGGSAFTDFLAHVDEGRIPKSFTLKEASFPFITKVKVNLLDGSFEVNGVKLQLNEDLPTDIFAPGEFKVVYHRQVQRDFQHRHVADKKGIFQTESITPGEVRIKYFLGWEITIAGKRYQQMIGLK